MAKKTTKKGPRVKRTRETAKGRSARTSRRAKTVRQAPGEPRTPPVTLARVSTQRLAAGDAAPAAPQPRSRGRGPETVQVILDLLDVAGRPIHDPETFFTFRRVDDNRQIGDQLQLALAGASPSFTLPVANGGTTVCEIDPKRYRFVHSEPFLLAPGPPIRRHRVVMREPKEWVPTFTQWGDLPARFDGLKRVLEASPNVTLFRGTEPIAERLTGATYDKMSGGEVVLAKTTLLNIFFRLNQAVDPVSTTPWFDFVTRLVAIGQERLLAFVRPELLTRVLEISENIDRFGDYERTPAENHRRNVPTALQSQILKMVSIKSSHRKANFQLTLSQLAGTDEALLDADLDESGDFLGHARDVIKHKISGGTHPHDIHELLVFFDIRSPGFDLGYALV